MIPEHNAEYLQGALDGDVQIAYAKCLDASNEHSEIDWNAVFKLLERTGTGPSREMVQKKYNDWMGIGETSCIIQLRHITGIEPEFSGEAVRKGYDVILKNERYTALHWMKELTGVPPDEGLMEKCYEDLFNVFCFAGEKPYTWVCGCAKMIKEHTGIAPSEELLKRYPEYAEALK